MTLTVGFHEVPKGHLAMVVTHLEMHARPDLRPMPDIPGIHLVRHQRLDTAWYKGLFRRIGQDYLWFSRLQMSDTELATIFNDPAYDLYTLQRDNDDLGLLELDFRHDGQCEIAFFGLDNTLIGSGAGRYLMNEAISRAFARPIERLHVHTCTLDSPQALAFYIRSGITAYKQQVEVAPDPRLTGELPAHCAPQIPLLG